MSLFLFPLFFFFSFLSLSPLFFFWRRRGGGRPAGPPGSASVYEYVLLYQGSLKGESVVAAILSSRMEQSYCTSGFFRFQARFLTSSAPILTITHYLRTQATFTSGGPLVAHQWTTGCHILMHREMCPRWSTECAASGGPLDVPHLVDH